MTREEKTQQIEALKQQLNDNDYVYLTDVSELNAETTSKLRRACFKKNVQLTVVKNTLLQIAMEQSDKELGELEEAVAGPTALMFAETGNVPAKLIKEFRKDFSKPILKGAYIEEMTYLGDDQLETLVNIKSREELIADVISALQAPAKNVISALQSGSNNLTGILKTLSEKEE
ncbi:MAG: 50S ribosomal protein L10 [Bacteroidales bacterium]|nr:50S ribosomal protein L10 [Bacteroidales bacterium]MCF8337867.1 50S ribosomal protein L10 [Bacteroidales bacterium]